MGWHYLDGTGTQQGPLDEQAFRLLIQNGQVTPATQVWREGMAGWQSHGSLSTPLAGETVVCTVSGQAVPKDQAVEIGGKWVSGEHKAEYLQKIKEGAALPGIVQYAGFWIRFGAKFIDGIIIGIPNVLIQMGITFLAAHPVVGVKPDPAKMVLAMGISMTVNFLLSFAYYVLFIGKYGATPGKMACKLKVVRAGGAPVGYGLAVGRFFAEWVSMLTLYIGYIMVAFDDEKRALHDRICNTRVIRK